MFLRIKVIDRRKNLSMVYLFVSSSLLNSYS